jgi:hypothetical protein
VEARELVRNLVQARFDELSVGDIGSKIGNFLAGDKAQAAFQSAASKAFNVVKDNHKAVLGAAVHLALHHVMSHELGVVAPQDLEDGIHAQIHHLANNLSVSAGMAHRMMTHAVGQLKAARGLAEEKDDELDAALFKLHKILKKIEPHYRDNKPVEPVVVPTSINIGNKNDQR